MPRSTWKGSIASGLVNIPVELCSAVRDHRPRFRLLHARDEAPIRYERVCQAEGKPIAWEASPKASSTNRAGSCVLPSGGQGEFRFPSSEGIRRQELEMAKQLVANLSADWDPGKYTDEYRENLLRVIQAKLKGRTPALVGRELPPQADVIDLMARLKASLESRGGRETSRRAPASKQGERTLRSVAASRWPGPKGLQIAAGRLTTFGLRFSGPAGQHTLLRHSTGGPSVRQRA